MKVDKGDFEGFKRGLGLDDLQFRQTVIEKELQKILGDFQQEVDSWKSHTQMLVGYKADQGVVDKLHS